jgi:hypothetical protein
VGAGGELNIDVGNGDAHIAVSSWSVINGRVARGADGKGVGDVELTVAAGLSGNITAQAGSDATVTGPNPLPADWTETPAAPNSKTYVFGPDAATMGTVAVTNSFTFGEIAILVD